MKRMICLLLAVVMVLPTLAGCRKAVDNSAYVPTGDAIVLEGQEPEETLSLEEEQQELNLAYYPDRSLNPLFGSDYTNRVIMSLMYQPLFAVDNQKNVTPILCSRYQISANSRNVTVYLEENATFSDGSRVTPADVVATYWKAKENDYYKNRFTHLINIEETEDGGILFQMNTRYQNFMLLMDVPIVKASEVEAEPPLGTGPYVFTETTAGYALQRNPNWWCGDLEIPAKDQTIDLVEVSSAADVRDAFQFGGEKSVSVVCANPMSGSFAEYRCDYELWEIESGYLLYLGCNILYSDHFDDGTLRTFLTYGIDRAALAQEAYKGMVDPVTLPCAPTEVYYNKTLASQFAYDPMKFVERLGRYSIPRDEDKGGSKELQILVNSDDSARVTVARNMAKHLTELGLPTTTMERSTGVYNDVVYWGSYDVYLGMTRLSANMDLSEFFRPYGEMARGGIAHESLYGMVKHALENEGNYYNLYQKLAEEGRIIPLMFGHYNVYAHRGLIPDLNPARDNVFYYSMGKNMEDSQIETVYEEE